MHRYIPHTRVVYVSKSDLPASEIHLKVFVPQLVINIKTNEDLKIVLMSLKPRGTAHMLISMCIVLRVKCCEIRQRFIQMKTIFCGYFLSEIIIGEAVIHVVVSSTVAHRNVNDYLNLDGISVSNKVSYFKMDHKYQNVAPNG